MNQLSNISFGAIKGYAKVCETDTREVPIDLPDGKDLGIGEKDGRLRLSIDPSKTYASVKIQNLSKDILVIDGNAQVEIQKVEKGGRIRQLGSSATNIGEFNGTLILDNAATSNIKLATHKQNQPFKIVLNEKSNAIIQDAFGVREFPKTLTSRMELNGHSKASILADVHRVRITTADKSKLCLTDIEDSFVEQKGQSEVKALNLKDTFVSTYESAKLQIAKAVKAMIFLSGNHEGKMSPEGPEAQIGSMNGHLSLNFHSKATVGLLEKGSKVHIYDDSKAEVKKKRWGGKVIKYPPRKTTEVKIDDDL